MDLPHTIGTQRLAIDAGSEQIARALVPRIDEVQRGVIVPVLAKVLDEMAVPGLHIRLSRIEVDLGAVPLSSFGPTVTATFERELRRALAEAIRAARERPGE